MLEATSRQHAADLLWQAQQDRTPIDPLTELLPGIDVVDAYEIQRLNIRRRLDTGALVRGHKVGLSSPVMQQMMGVDEPDYGHLLDTMVLSEDTPVDTSRYCCPRIEVEIGYVLGTTLPGQSCTEADVLAATEYVAPSLELIDSRIKDWKIGLADTIADNASSAGVILGSTQAAPDDLDLADIEAVLYTGDTEVTRGNSSAVLGNPTTAVAWLARKVASFGVTLEAGHVILPGSCTRAIDIGPGDEFRAEFAGLGTVTARMSPRLGEEIP
ncbi:2-keto-4-pentenoate hydratase [Halopolyspora algeriensis]|uniref:2-keto-4-pentenoate hydratase n=1 Tax=Halopolyspora algeriensis TaxID=1500506 RepID=A0A368VXI8_9ACTN|nr:2-keto-4-pentenoate hydratase [Halopolyspora algeriensis]RCW46070.1 2-keto-4-pentenoate hydratase [Halopolyspora algeriensis]TQM55476.1 2-keto-4-pentenoate hydratase [Halopolyspora algeriensis]